MLQHDCPENDIDRRFAQGTIRPSLPSPLCTARVRRYSLSMSFAPFPAARPRRTRASAWSRAMVAENLLTPADVIWPLFIAEGQGAEEPIASLPGVSRWSVDRIADKAREARDLGIPCLALFPNTPRDLRTDDAREALNPGNLICRAIREIKDQ